MKIDLLTKLGKKGTTSVEANDAVFKTEINESLVTQALYVYNSNQRQSNASTKNRGEVSGGGKKPWKQKGTGRARHGSSRSPIWKGGGVTFGPTNEINHKKGFNKKMKRAALRSALSMKMKEKQIVVIDDLEVAKTKEVQDIINNLKLDKKLTFLQKEENGLYKASKNMEGINVVRVGEMNIYNILDNKNLVITKSALEEINNKFAK